jgi:hypothetical protein
MELIFPKIHVKWNFTFHIDLIILKQKGRQREYFDNIQAISVAEALVNLSALLSLQ